MLDTSFLSLERQDFLTINLPGRCEQHRDVHEPVSEAEEAPLRTGKAPRLMSLQRLRRALALTQTVGLA